MLFFNIKHAMTRSVSRPDLKKALYVIWQSYNRYVKKIGQRLAKQSGGVRIDMSEECEGWWVIEG